MVCSILWNKSHELRQSLCYHHFEALIMPSGPSTLLFFIWPMAGTVLSPRVLVALSGSEEPAQQVEAVLMVGCHCCNVEQRSEETL